MTTTPDHDEGAVVAARTERRWTVMSAGIVGLLIGMAIFAGIHRATMPQAWVETANPQTLHISGEFVESNLGSAAEADGSVTVRAIGQQFSFTPQCILVPAGTPISFRATSSDVVHGFLIDHTNINSMLVPGYVSELPARFDTPGEHLPFTEQQREAEHHEGQPEMREDEPLAIQHRSASGVRPPS